MQPCRWAMVKRLAAWTACRPRSGLKRPASRVSVGVARRTSAPVARSRTTACSSRAPRSSRSTVGRSRSLPPPTIETRSGLHRQGRLELGADDVVEGAPAHGEVGVAEGQVLGGGEGVEVVGEPVGPSDVGVGALGVGVGHALGEGVADRDVAGPDPALVGRDGHGSLQSTGAAPASVEQGVGARERARPEEAAVAPTAGSGAADSMHGMPGRCGARVRASRPQRMATSGPPRSTSASMARPVTSSQPAARGGSRACPGAR